MQQYSFTTQTTGNVATAAQDKGSGTCHPSQDVSSSQARVTVILSADGVDLAVVAQVHQFVWLKLLSTQRTLSLV